MKKASKKKLSFFDKCILLLNICASCALLISYSASVVSPVHLWPVALFGLAYPFIFLLNCVFIFYWLFRKIVLGLISIACILAGFKTITATFGFHSQITNTKKHTSDTIRMMAYNVRAFTSANPAKNKDVQNKILQLINDEDPDIINLEEFSVNVSTNKNIYKSLYSGLGAKYHYFKPYDYDQYDSTGVAIFTHYPVINCGTVNLSNSKQDIQAIFADLKCNNQILRVYCVHLASTHFEEKEHTYLHDLAHHGKLSFHESALIGNKLKEAFVKRSYQVTLIKQHIAKCPYPFIIAGDFNDTPISYAVNQISAGIKNAFTEKGTGLGITYYGDFPNVQIDYIMASNQLSIIDYQCIKQKLSDHYPIISNLRIKE